MAILKTSLSGLNLSLLGSSQNGPSRKSKSDTSSNHSDKTKTDTFKPSRQSGERQTKATLERQNYRWVQRVASAYMRVNP